MENMSIKVDKKNNTMTIVIKTNVKTRPSSSGKSNILATTGGGQPVDGMSERFRLNLTAFEYPER